MPRELAFLALLSAPLARGGVVGEIEALEHAGSGAWDRAVAFHLLVAHDDNGSGAIDRRREVDAITCGTWRTLDLEIARRGEYPGLLMTYGFRRDLHWVGHALGFGKRVRRRAEQAMRACGVVDEGPLPDRVGEAASPGLGLVEHVLDNLDGEPPGLRDQVLGLALTIAHDDDGDGALSTADEVRAVPCAAWDAVDRVLRRDGDGLVLRFGLRDDLPWRGDALLLAPTVRDDVITAVHACGIRDARVKP